MEILFRGVVIRAVLFAVAAADMIGEVFEGLGVDVPCKLPDCTTGWTGVAGGRGFVGLEGERHGGWGMWECGFRISDFGMGIGDVGFRMLDVGMRIWN